MENRGGAGLDALGIGRRGVLIQIQGCIDKKIFRRLLELGFVSGAKVRIEQKSMAGDVLLVEVCGYLLSIRKNIAKYILVSEV